MKIKILLIVILSLILVPNVDASATETYQNIVPFVNNYIRGFNKYNHYIVKKEEQNKFKIENGKVLHDEDFKLGGLINREEFETAGGKESYLFDGQNYWTMTRITNGVYEINKSTSNNLKLLNTETNKSGVRVTQYVKSSTSVTGKGTYTEPWEFVPIKEHYNVLIKVQKKEGFTEKEYKDVYYETNLEDTITVDENRTTEGSEFFCESPKEYIIKNAPSEDGKTTDIFIEEVANDYECVLQTLPRMMDIKINSNIEGALAELETKVEHSTDYSIPISKVEGYSLEGIIIEGCSAVVEGSNLIFRNVKEHQTCEVTFRKEVNINVTATNGSVNPTNKTAAQGWSTTFELNPDVGYMSKDSTLTGCGDYEINDNTLTLKNIEGDLNCHIDFAVGRFTVTFNGNGGTPSSTTKEVVVGQPYGTLPSASRTNCYSFSGWYTSASGGTAVTASTIFNNYSNITLYARWASNPTGGTWGSCDPDYLLSSSRAEGTEYNSCGGTRYCTVSCYYDGESYQYPSKQCGKVYDIYNCNGTTFKEYSYTESCVTRPTCTLTISPSSFSYAKVVTASVTGRASTEIDDAWFSGLKSGGTAVISGTTVRLSGGTIGAYCSGASSCSDCEWCGTNYIDLTVSNSAGSGSCSDSYTVN